MNPGLIPWVDMYSFLPDPRGRELRRKNKERLADLEQRTPERHERFKAAARAWQAERDDMAIPVRCLTCGQRTTPTQTRTLPTLRPHAPGRQHPRMARPTSPRPRA